MSAVRTKTRLEAFAVRAVLLGVSLTALSSCALFGPKPDAQVSLVDMAFTNVTLFETTADVAVRVENRSPDPITIDGGVHRLSINGTELGSGVTSDALSLAPYASGVQRVQLHLSNIAMLTRIKSLVERQRFQYDIESELPVRMNGIRRTVDISRSGSVTPEDFQSFP